MKPDQIPVIRDATIEAGEVNYLPQGSKMVNLSTGQVVMTAPGIYVSLCDARSDEELRAVVLAHLPEWIE